MSLGIDYNDLLAFAKDVHEARSIIDNLMIDRVQKSLDVFQQAVFVETPVGVSGNLRSSLMTYIEGVSLDWTGTLTTALPYGLPVEFGRDPGRLPPVAALELWVVRKWGLQGEDATQAAWALARHIGKWGTKGAFMFQKGFDNALPAVMRLWDDLPDVVIKQV